MRARLKVERAASVWRRRRTVCVLLLRYRMKPTEPFSSLMAACVALVLYAPLCARS